MKSRWFGLSAFLLSAFLPNGMYSQGTQAVLKSTLLAEFQDSQIEVTPYVWGLQINSDDQLGQQSLNAELSLGRILHNLTGLAEIEVVPRYKHAFVFGDGIYASLDPKPKQVIPGVDHINLQAGLATVAAGYAFGPIAFQKPGHLPAYLSFGPFVGAQYTDLDVTARSATPSTVAHLASQWWTPTVGARIDGQTGHSSPVLRAITRRFKVAETANRCSGPLATNPAKRSCSFHQSTSAIATCTKRTCWHHRRFFD